MSQQKILSQVYLFKDLTSAELETIGGIIKEKNCNAGVDLFIAGQKAESFFIIKHGSVKIYATTQSGDDVNITTMSSGDHFGEMPFLDGAKRSATAQTLEPSTVLEIGYLDLERALQQQPAASLKIYKAIAKHLCQRLRLTNDDLSKLREVQLKHS